MKLSHLSRLEKRNVSVRWVGNTLICVVWDISVLLPNKVAQVIYSVFLYYGWHKNSQIQRKYRISCCFSFHPQREARQWKEFSCSSGGRTALIGGTGCTYIFQKNNMGQVKWFLQSTGELNITYLKEIFQIQYFIHSLRHSLWAAERCRLWNLYQLTEFISSFT